MTDRVQEVCNKCVLQDVSIRMSKINRKYRLCNIKIILNYNIECNFIAKYLIFLLQILKDMFRSVLCSKHFFNIMENEQDISDVKSFGILLNFS